MYLTLGGGGDTDTRGSYTCIYVHTCTESSPGFYERGERHAQRSRVYIYIYRGLRRRLPREHFHRPIHIVQKSPSLYMYTCEFSLCNGRGRPVGFVRDIGSFFFLLSSNDCVCVCVCLYRGVYWKYKRSMKLIHAGAFYKKVLNATCVKMSFCNEDIVRVPRELSREIKLIFFRERHNEFYGWILRSASLTCPCRTSNKSKIYLYVCSL